MVYTFFHSVKLKIHPHILVNKTEASQALTCKRTAPWSPALILTIHFELCILVVIKAWAYKPRRLASRLFSLAFLTPEGWLYSPMGYLSHYLCGICFYSSRPSTQILFFTDLFYVAFVCSHVLFLKIYFESKLIISSQRFHCKLRILKP